MDTSWTKHSAMAVPRPTPHPLQNDGRGFHCRHFPCLFVYKMAHPCLNSIDATAIRGEFSVERHTAIVPITIDCGKNVFVRFDPNEFAGLQIEINDRSGLTSRDNSFPSWIRYTADECLKLIIKPARRRTYFISPFRQQMVIAEIDKAAKHPTQCHVS